MADWASAASTAARAMRRGRRPIKAENCLWGITGLASRWWSGMLVRRWMLRWRRLWGRPRTRARMPAGAGGLGRARPFGEDSNDRHQEAKEHDLFHSAALRPLVGFRCECLGRADHGDQLGYRCGRPEQANGDHDGDTDRYAHLHPLCVVWSLAYFLALQCEVVHS